MERRTKFAILLMPLSMMLLSVLRAGQFLPEHASSIVDRAGLVLSKLATSDADESTYRCEHAYTVELLSLDPLAIYINNFLRDDEIDHLLALGEPRFRTSTVFAGSQGFHEVLNTTLRSSQTAFLPQDDPVCRCLAGRLQSFLGNVQHLQVEALQIVKYEAGGDHYKSHTDWFDAPKVDLAYGPEDATPRPSNRLASVFAYLADCERGETYFPYLPPVTEAADGSKFALADGDTGLLVRPRKGNAIFWNNLHANGTGDDRTYHAGLPVESGTKIGLNIWSRYFLDTPMVGGGS
ncbi:hypothetical protein VTK73DRAFT_7287 [Phialemonium thermophilum]|uniref:Fe2OG dioxygenase domain-containing protein n=1 Tax=Phialemonium thermophilum TaxID=223376 RepID=A0ABR3WFC5_9PEZI